MKHRGAVVTLLSLVLGSGLAVSPAKAACSSDPYADFIVESTTTTGVATRVLGAPNGVTVDFENDGNDPGFVTVGFNADVIVDGPGVDFSIYVVDFPAVETVETFEVWVSEDGESWVSLGLVVPTNPFQDKKEKRSFDLQPFGLSIVRQIKVVNATVNTLLTAEGPDLDAFQAVNCASVADIDLLECENDLDVCETELVTCDGELDDCGADLDGCSSDLDACSSDLATCDGQLDVCEDLVVQCDAALDTAQADLSEVAAGLAEIQRLLSLPPGKRQTTFTCSGSMCAQLRAILGALVVPPGQNVRKGR